MTGVPLRHMLSPGSGTIRIADLGGGVAGRRRAARKTTEGSRAGREYTRLCRYRPRLLCRRNGRGLQYSDIDLATQAEAESFVQANRRRIARIGVQERSFAPLANSDCDSGGERAARPRPRKSGCVHTPLTSVKPSTFILSPAIAASRPSILTPRKRPRRCVRGRNGPGSVSVASASISGASASSSSTILKSQAIGATGSHATI